jgi:aspartate 1-decarboxylase
VDKIVLGTFYVYKATTSRKPTVTEIGLLKWSVKFDNGERLIINGVASLNKLDGDKIIIQLVLKHDFEKARIYAFYQKAEDGVSIEVKNKNIFQTYIIAKSRHRKGMNEAGKAIHHDMMSGDMTDQQIIALNPDIKKWIDIVNKEGYLGIQKLAIEMEDLLTDFSRGELEDVNLKLYRKFTVNKEGVFQMKF